MTIDTGWSGSDITVCRDNVNMPEVVEYAKSKGVKVIIWVGGTNVARQMDEAFSLYEKWGVAGMKIDFILRDDQGGVPNVINGTTPPIRITICNSSLSGCWPDRWNTPPTRCAR